MIGPKILFKESFLSIVLSCFRWLSICIRSFIGLSFIVFWVCITGMGSWILLVVCALSKCRSSMNFSQARTMICGWPVLSFTRCTSVQAPQGRTRSLFATGRFSSSSVSLSHDTGGRRLCCKKIPRCTSSPKSIRASPPGTSMSSLTAHMRGMSRSSCSVSAPYTSVEWCTQAAHDGRFSFKQGFSTTPSHKTEKASRFRVLLCE